MLALTCGALCELSASQDLAGVNLIAPLSLHYRHDCEPMSSCVWTACIDCPVIVFRSVSSSALDAIINLMTLVSGALVIPTQGC